MAREAVLQSEPPEEERQRNEALRPRWLREVIGQKAVVQRLQILLNACQKFKEPLSHILFDGPPGLGKTTFATVLPNELGTSIQMTSGPAIGGRVHFEEVNFDSQRCGARRHRPRLRPHSRCDGEGRSPSHRERGRQARHPARSVTDEVIATIEPAN